MKHVEESNPAVTGIEQQGHAIDVEIYGNAASDVIYSKLEAENLRINCSLTGSESINQGRNEEVERPPETELILIRELHAK